ncbi:unnamed protein product [Discosporangium mesarthrocarpum]
MLLHTVYWLHLMETRKMKRCFGVAQQAAWELGATLPERLRLSLSFLSVLVTMTITPEQGAALRLRDPTGWGVGQGAIMALAPRLQIVGAVSFVLQQLLRIVHPGPSGAIVDSPMQLQMLLGMLEEADNTVQRVMHNCSQAIAIVIGLKGYIQLRLKKVSEAVTSARRVCASLVADSYILNLPLTFSLVEACRALLQNCASKQQDTPDHIEGKLREIINDELRSRLKFAGPAQPPPLPPPPPSPTVAPPPPPTAVPGGLSRGRPKAPGALAGLWCALVEEIYRAYQSARILSPPTSPLVKTGSSGAPVPTLPMGSIQDQPWVRNPKGQTPRKLSRAELASRAWQPEEPREPIDRGIWRQSSEGVILGLGGTHGRVGGSRGSNHPDNINRTQSLETGLWSGSPSSTGSNSSSSNWGERLRLIGETDEGPPLPGTVQPFVQSNHGGMGKGTLPPRAPPPSEKLISSSDPQVARGGGRSGQVHRAVGGGPGSGTAGSRSSGMYPPAPSPQSSPPENPLGPPPTPPQFGARAGGDRGTGLGRAGEKVWEQEPGGRHAGQGTSGGEDIRLQGPRGSGAEALGQGREGREIGTLSRSSSLDDPPPQNPRMVGAASFDPNRECSDLRDLLLSYPTLPSPSLGGHADGAGDLPHRQLASPY